MVWYGNHFQNFPQFIVIHTVKGFGMVNKAEIDVFLELSCFCNDPADIGSLISRSSAFSKTSLNIWNILSVFHIKCLLHGTYLYHPPKDHFIVDKITLETYYSLFALYMEKFSIVCSHCKAYLTRKDFPLLRKDNILIAVLNFRINSFSRYNGNCFSGCNKFC